jgi:hypothetical protein
MIELRVDGETLQLGIDVVPCGFCQSGQRQFLPKRQTA